MTTAYYQAVAYHSLINYLLQMSGCAAGRPVGRSMGPIVTIYHFPSFIIALTLLQKPT